MPGLPEAELVRQIEEAIPKTQRLIVVKNSKSTSGSAAVIVKRDGGEPIAIGPIRSIAMSMGVSRLQKPGKEATPKPANATDVGQSS